MYSVSLVGHALGRQPAAGLHLHVRAEIAVILLLWTGAGLLLLACAVRQLKCLVCLLWSQRTQALSFLRASAVAT